MGSKWQFLRNLDISEKPKLAEFSEFRSISHLDKHETLEMNAPHYGYCASLLDLGLLCLTRRLLIAHCSSKFFFSFLLLRRDHPEKRMMMNPLLLDENVSKAAN